MEGLAWGTYTVTETKAPEGYEVGTPASFTFEIDADNAGTVVAGDPVKNTRVVPTLRLVKELDIQFGAPAVAGDWTLTAEAQGESTAKLEGASGVTGELEAGVYDLSEAGPAGYDLADLTCVNSDDEELATSVENPEVTLERGVNAICTFTNVDQPGDVVWEKVDDSTDAKLPAGSEWTLAGRGVPVDTVVTDCVEADCPAGAYLDQDPAAGKFKLEDLEWGTYILKETKAPEGYELDDASYEFTISGTRSPRTLAK